MLAKEKRLNLKKDFKWVTSGDKLEGTILKLFIKFGDNLKPRVGIAVSSKSFPKAVDRNRARRLVSKGFEDLYLTLPSNINIIAMPKSGILACSAEEVEKELGEILKKSSVTSRQTN